MTADVIGLEKDAILLHSILRTMRSFSTAARADEISLEKDAILLQSGALETLCLVSPGGAGVSNLRSSIRVGSILPASDDTRDFDL